MVMILMNTVLLLLLKTFKLVSHLRLANTSMSHKKARTL